MQQYNYILSDTAKDNLENIERYLSDNLHNPKAAKDFYLEFNRIIESICTTPYGLPSAKKESLRKRGIRYFFVKNYKIYYSVNENNKTLNILFIRHSLQN